MSYTDFVAKTVLQFDIVADYYMHTAERMARGVRSFSLLLSVYVSLSETFSRSPALPLSRSPALPLSLHVILTLFRLVLLPCRAAVYGVDADIYGDNSFPEGFMDYSMMIVGRTQLASARIRGAMSALCAKMRMEIYLLPQIFGPLSEILETGFAEELHLLSWTRPFTLAVRQTLDPRPWTLIDPRPDSPYLDPRP
eukprot:38564-Rhodomonas_salina.4